MISKLGGNTMVKVEKVCKSYGEKDGIVQALSECSLEIPYGSFVSIIGSSGSGKSTLLNIIGGLLTPDSGRVCIHDVSITDLNESQLLDFRREHIGYVYQDFNLIPELTAEENIKLPLYFSKKTVDDQRFRMLITELGLNNRLSHKPSELSGGQQQRVSIARALLPNPDVILCDEPTGNLDSISGSNVMNLLLELQKKYKTTILMVTHNLSLAEMTDCIVHIENGKIIRE